MELPKVTWCMWCFGKEFTPRALALPLILRCLLGGAQARQKL